DKYPLEGRRQWYCHMCELALLSIAYLLIYRSLAAVLTLPASTTAIRVSRIALDDYQQETLCSP
ncbi:unnamed protein product, partial [Adineta steineri]